MNIASISNRLGIKPKEVLQLNKNGKLYEAICKKNEGLNAQNELKDEIDDFKKNEIKNSQEYNKITRHITTVEDGEMHDFVIYFNQTSKAIEVGDRNHKNFMSSKEIENSYQMKATLYSKDDEFYLKIHNVSYPMNPQMIFTGDEADKMRQEVLDIYKTQK